MKTAGKEIGNCWTAWVPRHLPETPQVRSCGAGSKRNSGTCEECFLLTSPSIEHSHSDGYCCLINAKNRKLAKITSLYRFLCRTIFQYQDDSVLDIHTVDLFVPKPDCIERTSQTFSVHRRIWGHLFQFRYFHHTASPGIKSSAWRPTRKSIASTKRASTLCTPTWSAKIMMPSGRW